MFARVGGPPARGDGTVIVLVHGRIISSLYMVPTAEVARLLPQGHLALIPGGPPCVNYSTPRQFSEIVVSFLKG